MKSVAYLSVFLAGFLVSSPLVEVKADTCAREWLQYQGNCYGYFETQMTWHEAEIECQSYRRGAHLASLLTPAETLVVANHIAAYQTDISNVWIGLHDIRHSGIWRWSDESTYNYKAWMPGAPNNLGKDEYCVELRHSVREEVVPGDGAPEQIAVGAPMGSAHERRCHPEERVRSERAEFSKWNDAKCHKLNSYICKHEL
ncbi:C-type lectin domain-containing protein [Podarcis lilfordi]|uniref:C-type lectin domain-containing protein n=1 Tax=Podarcis lilfordi TaxID=74358 RepID=A0AA35QQW1_9SAUR|nr:C-type lectin domain-containing protein [Podarcis lilfordi]